MNAGVGAKTLKHVMLFNLHHNHVKAGIVVPDSEKKLEDNQRSEQPLSVTIVDVLVKLFMDA